MITLLCAAAGPSKSAKAPKAKPFDNARAIVSTGPAAAKHIAPVVTAATPASSSNSTVEVQRSLAIKALAAEVLQMVLPGLLKMSKTAVRKSLEDQQVRYLTEVLLSCGPKVMTKHTEHVPVPVLLAAESLCLHVSFICHCLYKAHKAQCWTWYTKTLQRAFSMSVPIAVRVLAANTYCVE